jgi:hypothetical protein
MQNNLLVFLLYDSRSGSTYLSSRLNAHRDIGVTVESNLMRTLLLKKEKIQNARNQNELYEIVSYDQRFKNLTLDFESFSRFLSGGIHFSLQVLADAILTAYFSKVKPNAKVWIVKDGANGYIINQIAEELPAAKFIHLIRDGRAVLNSKLWTIRPYGKGEKMARDPITAAKQWCRLVQNIDNFTAKYPNRVLTVKYEDLIYKEPEELGNILAFLNLPDDEMDDHWLYFEQVPSKEKSIHGLVSRETDISRVDGWKMELDISNLLVFEYLAHEVLERHGYSSVSSGRFSTTVFSPRFLRVFINSLGLRLKDWLFLLPNYQIAKRIIENKKIRSKG